MTRFRDVKVCNKLVTDEIDWAAKWHRSKRHKHSSCVSHVVSIDKRVRTRLKLICRPNQHTHHKSNPRTEAAHKAGFGGKTEWLSQDVSICQEVGDCVVRFKVKPIVRGMLLVPATCQSSARLTNTAPCDSAASSTSEGRELLVACSPWTARRVPTKCSLRNHPAC